MCIRIETCPSVYWDKILCEWVDEGENESTFPGRAAPIVIAPEGETTVVSARFGFPPPTAHLGEKRLLHNARSESVHWKPSFRESYDKRRALVIVRSYFEQHQGYWHRVSRRDGKRFALGGLYTSIPDDLLGDLCFTIITTQSTSRFEAYNDRSPVLLGTSGYGPWLDSRTPPEDLRMLMMPWASEQIVVEQHERLGRK